MYKEFKRSKLALQAFDMLNKGNKKKYHYGITLLVD